MRKHYVKYTLYQTFHIQITGKQQYHILNFTLGYEITECGLRINHW